MISDSEALTSLERNSSSQRSLLRQRLSQEIRPVQPRIPRKGRDAQKDLRIDQQLNKKHSQRYIFEEINTLSSRLTGAPKQSAGKPNDNFIFEQKELGDTELRFFSVHKDESKFLTRTIGSLREEEPKLIVRGDSSLRHGLPPYLTKTIGSLHEDQTHYSTKAIGSLHEEESKYITQSNPSLRRRDHSKFTALTNSTRRREQSKNASKMSSSALKGELHNLQKSLQLLTAPLLQSPAAQATVARDLSPLAHSTNLVSKLKKKI